MMVNLAQLDALGPDLSTVEIQVREAARDAVRVAHEAAYTDGDPGRCGLGSGKIPEVAGLSGRMLRIHTEVDDNLAAVSVVLKETAGAVAEIARKYRAHERRQTQAAEALRRRPT